MLIYESEVGRYQNGTVFIKTTTSGGEKIGRIKKIEREIYSSENELRKALVREIFYKNILKFAILYGGGYIAGFAIGKMITENDWIPYFTGVTGMSVAEKFSKRYLPSLSLEVDSRIEALRQAFPDLEPVSFNPRDYLSTIRLPFRR